MPPYRPTRAMNRLMRDVAHLQECKDLATNVGITIQLTENMREFTVFIRGPPDTPYQRASYQALVRVPTTYPYDPPIITFVTKLWHPNISSRNGAVCVDVLKEKWSPSLDLRTALLTVQNLLENPDDESPQDMAAGQQMRENIVMFQRTARVWTKKFGIGGSEAPGDEELEGVLGRLVEMGVFMPRALRYLSENDWNLQQAVQRFFPEDE